MTPEELKQLFDNKSDCYADSNAVTTAMTRERFVEVVSKLMGVRQMPAAPESEVKYEHRTDCADFQPKRHDNDCGDCQTDGHYLCGGCRHIAPFEQMQEGDNAIRYYPEQEKQRIVEEKRLLELSDADEKSTPKVVPPDKSLTKEQIDTLNDIDREYKELMNDYFAGY